MGTTATGLGGSHPTTAAGTAGDRVHRLLDRAAALAATAAPTTTPPHWAQATTTGAGGAGGGAVAGDDPFTAARFGVDLGAFTDTECVAWARDVEDVIRLAQALAVAAAGELAHRVGAGRYTTTGIKNTVDLLEQTLHLGRGEAHQRLRLATELLPGIDTITGALTPPPHPVLGAALADGAINTEQASTVLGFLQESDRLAENGRIDTTIPDAIEHDLTTTATTHNPAELRALGQRILANLDPDGTKPSDADLRAKQGLFFRKPRRGLIGIYGHCTIEQYEHIMATISHATNPNHHKDINTINTINTNDDGGSTNAGGGSGSGSASGSGGGGSSNGGSGGGVMDGQGNLLDHLETTTTYLNGTNEAHTAQDARAGGTSGTGGNASTATTTGSSSGSIHPSGSHPPPTTTTGPTPKNRTASTGQAPSPALDPGQDPVLDQGQAAGDRQDEPTAGQDPDRGGNGFGPGWYSGRLGDDTRPTDDTPDGREPIAPWPHLVDGIPIPEPGNGDELPSLDTTNPDTTTPAARDQRTHGQKLLDGLLSCLKLASRTNTLPVNGGLKSQLIITCSEADLHRTDGTGTAYTTHSGPMPLSLFSTTLCDPDITRLSYSEGQTIINAGRTQRLFTPTQHKLLFARDLGCAFPGCQAPATHCEAHHITPWHQGGETNLNNAVLLCSHHHTLLHNSQWTTQLITGTPYFTPPPTIDPTQTPLRNTYHHGLNNPTPPPTTNTSTSTDRHQP